MTGSPGGQPQPRPDVVQAVFGALTDMNPAKLEEITDLGITPAELAQAEDLFAASLDASLPHRRQTAQAWRILTDGPPLPEGFTWQDLFDRLTPERTEELRDLYDALPDGARAEWDSRYGRPADL